MGVVLFQVDADVILIDRQGNLVGLLPPGAGQRQIVIDHPEWLAVAEMLVRKL